METIGAYAFAGCNLDNIIMGSKVKNIGEMAFDGCPAETVYITTPEPTTADNNTFSNYSGKLYLQNEQAKHTYYNASPCWNLFDSYAMVEPTALEVSKNDSTDKPGDTIQLTATLEPDNVTLPQIFWRSTNTEVATVDNNGLVTLMGREGSSAATRAAAQCKIIAETLYANGPVAEIDISNGAPSDVTVVIPDRTERSEIDYNAPYEVYTMGGLRMACEIDALTPGLYIVRQGSTAKKIAVR